jgi:hypothetical protein
VTPGPSTWSHGGHGGGGDDGRDDNLPDGGIIYHQSTQQWIDVLDQSETSTGLAPAKPKDIEDNTRSEVNACFTPPKIVLYTDGLDCS